MVVRKDAVFLHQFFNHRHSNMGLEILQEFQTSLSSFDHLDYTDEHVECQGLMNCEYIIKTSIDDDGIVNFKPSSLKKKKPLLTDKIQPIDRQN